MATIASGSAAYITVQDLLNRFDLRPIEQLLSDTGTPVAQGTISAFVNSILMEASGMLEAAATVGQRYIITPTQNDLTTIANSATNTAEFLKGVACSLAYWMIWERRPEWCGGDPEKSGMRVKVAFDALDKLRDGVWIFGTLEAMQAGEMNDTVLTEQVILQQNGPTTIARRLFGPRVQDYVGMRPPPHPYP